MHLDFYMFLLGSGNLDLREVFIYELIKTIIKFNNS
jgi:hypothetical protein